MQTMVGAIWFTSCIVLAQVPDFESPHHPSRVLVQFQSGVNQAGRQSAHEDADALQVLKEYSTFEGLQLVEVAEGDVEQAVLAYLDSPDILHAEPDYERTLTAACNSDDPYLASDLWGVKKVRAPEAWCLTTGDDDFLVAVIDSGIGGYDHPDLVANMWVNPVECPDGIDTCFLNANNIDDDANGFVDDFFGWNFHDDTNDVIDNVPGTHGTHVAGTIGAVGNNGEGVVGMNWQVKLVILKYSDGTGFVSEVLEALDYCVTNDIKVSNNSYIGGGYSASECAAIQSAGDQIGHIFVAAAGNSGTNLDTNPQYPAACQVSNIITVTATNQYDNRACMKVNACPPNCPPTCQTYASYGYQTVHLGAPGADIYSTVFSDQQVASYDFRTGTSMATPHVAGAVALAWAQHPTWTYSQVRNLILGSVDKSPISGPSITGGRLDIAAAFLDCNLNGVADGIDVNTFTSLDCNGNNVPDECDKLGSCCVPEGWCAECVTKSYCNSVGGAWDSFTNCLPCAFSPAP